MSKYRKLTQLLGLLLAIAGSSTLPLNGKINVQEKTAEQAVWLDWESGSSGKDGGAGRVALKLQGSELANLGAAQFELNFPADTWEFSSAKAGRMLSSALLESNLIEPGKVKVAFVSSESIDGTGTLIELDFRRLASQGSAESVRLENFRAWRQADSSDSSFVIRPGIGSTVAAELPPSQPTDQAPQSVPVASVPVASVPFSSPVVVTPPAPEFRFPEAFTVKLELPGWQWFVAGTLVGLLVGGLLGWNLRRTG